MVIFNPDEHNIVLVTYDYDFDCQQTKEENSSKNS